MSLLFQVTRWTARIVGGFLVGMFLLFFVAHAINATEIPSLTPLEGSLLFCMLASLFGMVTLWFREGLGGLMTLVGIGAFCTIDAAANGRLPGGWVLPLYYVPGILSIVAWALSRHARFTTDDDGDSASGRLGRRMRNGSRFNWTLVPRRPRRR